MAELSKTQQKKARKRECKTLRELADLYRKRAQSNLEMAKFYEVKAMELDDNQRLNARQKKREEK